MDPPPLILIFVVEVKKDLMEVDGISLEQRQHTSSAHLFYLSDRYRIAPSQALMQQS